MPATGTGTGSPARRHRPPGLATGTAKHRPAWRRGKAPARLRPELNKKPATREGKPARESGQQLSAAAGWVELVYFMRETVARVPIRWPAGNCSKASHLAKRRFTVSTRISATVAPSRTKRTSHGRTFGIIRNPPFQNPLRRVTRPRHRPQVCVRRKWYVPKCRAFETFPRFRRQRT